MYYTNEHDDCLINIPHQHPGTILETFTELLSAILTILPDAQIGEDNDGQLVIFTNKILVTTLTGELSDDIVDMPEENHG
jgi:hypothetical protein